MKKLLSLAFLAVLGWSSLAHAGSNPETLKLLLSKLAPVMVSSSPPPLVISEYFPEIISAP